jgi:hypothetical protein
MLTGRGAALGIFVLSFFGLVAADWLGWGLLTGGVFVVACVLGAARTKPSDLLTVAVSPPALFLAAVICGKALTSSGGLLLTTTEGTLITLTDTAPWLIVGTALSLAIALYRGLWENVRALGRELHIYPAAQRRGPGNTDPRRPSA